MRDQAIACLLVSRTVYEAASRARVSYRQLREWLKADEAFRQAYVAARRQAIEHALGQLQAASTTAVARLRRLLGSGDETVALRAAQAILTHAIAATEHLDVMDRLAALEEAAKGRGATR